MPLSPREQQIKVAQEREALLQRLLDAGLILALETGVWMPWATVDGDGDPVLFATEELANAYVGHIHEGDSAFLPSQIPVRTEPEPDE